MVNWKFLYSYFSCLPLLEKASNAPEDPSRVIIIGSVAGISEGDHKSLVGKLHYTHVRIYLFSLIDIFFFPYKEILKPPFFYLQSAWYKC